MKQRITRAEAARLAQAKELIKAQAKGVSSPPCDSDGKIVPSRETVAELEREYEIIDRVVVRVRN